MRLLLLITAAVVLIALAIAFRANDGSASDKTPRLTVPIWEHLGNGQPDSRLQVVDQVKKYLWLTESQEEVVAWLGDPDMQNAKKGEIYYELFNNRYLLLRFENDRLTQVSQVVISDVLPPSTKEHSDGKK